MSVDWNFRVIAVVTVGFENSSYTISEADHSVKVCVSILTGVLGTDIALQIETHNGTANGETCNSSLPPTSFLLFTVSE